MTSEITCGKCGCEFELDERVKRGACSGAAICPRCDEQVDASTGEPTEGSCGRCNRCAG